MILAIWEYVEEKVYRKFEIKLKLTVNDDDDELMLNVLRCQLTY